VSPRREGKEKKGEEILFHPLRYEKTAIPILYGKHNREGKESHREEKKKLVNVLFHESCRKREKAVSRGT